MIALRALDTGPARLDSSDAMKHDSWLGMILGAVLMAGLSCPAGFQASVLLLRKTNHQQLPVHFFVFWALNGLFAMVSILVNAVTSSPDDGFALSYFFFSFMGIVSSVLGLLRWLDIQYPHRPKGRRDFFFLGAILLIIMIYLFCTSVTMLILSIGICNRDDVPGNFRLPAVFFAFCTVFISIGLSVALAQEKVAAQNPDASVPLASANYTSSHLPARQEMAHQTQGGPGM